MTERILVDNDVVLKIAAWRLQNEFVSATLLDGEVPAILGVARFVVAARLAKAKSIANRDAASAAFQALLVRVALIEPDEEEVAFAADLEAKAVSLGLELDGGESQLLAILLQRGCDLLLTGDKRAIAAMAVVAPPEACQKVACLEQLMAHIVTLYEVSEIRGNVCAEPKIDKAVTACFSCASDMSPAQADVLAGLASYTGHLARSAPKTLLMGPDLASVLPD